ncbi:hypothetical protein BpHYR1_017291 [Brachionus plicatilis]|uniref:Uncharacterized protein n=1 Tax=Brachionus plicatilis TaxID=10195 RepID=A0A3M7QVJ2_BRAPC|nr:hypothetical protein BpHYR1_017291 [Brachionus plicatilis]
MKLAFDPSKRLDKNMCSLFDLWNIIKVSSIPQNITARTNSHETHKTRSFITQFSSRISFVIFINSCTNQQKFYSVASIFNIGSYSIEIDPFERVSIYKQLKNSQIDCSDTLVQIKRA